MREVVSRPIEAERRRSQFADDVEYYLALEPRQLPSRYLYDALGSALFQAICRLPWYRVTRAERRLIAEHGRAILRHVAPVSRLVELGPGNGEKLADLIEAGREGRDDAPLTLHLIDVSSEALSTAARTLSALANVEVVTHQAAYEVGLAEITRRAHGDGRTLTLFLGSNIGNFDPPGAEAFLRSIRTSLGVGDALLLGADLVKPVPELLAAYDDPLGVTAAFNINLLVRINSELGGNFDISSFRHRALWNASESRVELHLVSCRRQHVRVEASRLAFTLEAGETIWTESSYKYQPADILAMTERATFRPLDQWIDDEDRFALTLVQAI